MGESEFGKCNICNQDTSLSRKYYYYDIKCECCNSENDPHFEIVHHCIHCKPKPPRVVKATLNPIQQYMNKRIFALGDCHGNNLGLNQCLERANFDFENDTLISLGDLIDGYSESYECVETLLKAKNLISVRGNHDFIFLDWMLTGTNKFGWGHGGEQTLLSYIKNADRKDIKCIPHMGGYQTDLTTIDLPKSHVDFYTNQLPYYIDSNNRLFVHGGFNRHYKITEQAEDIMLWDRDLFNSALSYEAMSEESKSKNKFKMVDNFLEVFIGHTPTLNWLNPDKSYITLPMKAANIYNLDTGGGYKHGKITIMNVDTKEFFQSDLSVTLYPNEKGR
jgi:serine/threonine protein phosphatase 1